MALAAVDVDSLAYDTWGRQRTRVMQITFDSSYPTGGESFTAAMAGMAEVKGVFLSPLASGYMVQWDRANAKLQVFVEEAVAAGGPLLEVADTTDLSALVVVALVVGR